MGGSGSEELKKCPPPFPAVLRFVNVCGKKKKKQKIFSKAFSEIKKAKQGNQFLCQKYGNKKQNWNWTISELERKC